MMIYLMRHGEASWKAPTDFDRQLTERGQKEVLSQALTYQEELGCVDQVFTSPIVRAGQTCERVVGQIGFSGRVIRVDWLRHEASANQAIENLYALLGSDYQGAVMLFSHQPLASNFVAALTGLDPVNVPMNTASIAAIKCSSPIAGMGQLEWLTHP